MTKANRSQRSVGRGGCVYFHGGGWWSCVSRTPGEFRPGEQESVNGLLVACSKCHADPVPSVHYCVPNGYYRRVAPYSRGRAETPAGFPWRPKTARIDYYQTKAALRKQVPSTHLGTVRVTFPDSSTISGPSMRSRGPDSLSRTVRARPCMRARGPWVRMTPSRPARATTIPPATSSRRFDTSLGWWSPYHRRRRKNEPLRHQHTRTKVFRSTPSMANPTQPGASCIGPASSSLFNHHTPLVLAGARSVNARPGESCSLYPMRLKVPRRSLLRI